MDSETREFKKIEDALRNAALDKMLRIAEEVTVSAETFSLRVGNVLDTLSTALKNLDTLRQVLDDE